MSDVSLILTHHGVTALPNSLVRHALELKKPVLLLNVGPTRADGLLGIDKIEMASSRVMRDTVRAVLYVPFSRPRTDSRHRVDYRPAGEVAQSSIRSLSIC